MYNAWLYIDRKGIHIGKRGLRGLWWIHSGKKANVMVMVMITKVVKTKSSRNLARSVRWKVSFYPSQKIKMKVMQKRPRRGNEVNNCKKKKGYDPLGFFSFLYANLKSLIVCLFKPGYFKPWTWMADAFPWCVYRSQLSELVSIRHISTVFLCFLLRNSSITVSFSHSLKLGFSSTDTVSLA